MALGPSDIELVPTLSSFPSIVSDKNGHAKPLVSVKDTYIYVYINIYNGGPQV